MSWRLAKAIAQLRAEVDAAWPGRDRASDGTIGDAAHKGEGWTSSDHNPWVVDAHGVGVVRALDVDAGPGLDPSPAPIGEAVAEAARRAGATGHPAMGAGAYVIWRRRIASAKSSPPWSWRPYTGADPHTSHPHISVGTAPAAYDSTRPWGLAPAAPADPTGGLDVQVTNPANGQSWPAERALWSIWTYAIRAANDAHAANATATATLAATKALANAQGVDGDQVVEAVRAEVRAALDGAQLTLSAPAPGAS